MTQAHEHTISLTTARRLAISKQRLAGERAPATTSGILDVVRDLGCVQLDPISAVARSHTLVLWSRVGNYDLAELDRLLWDERQLFEYWAHCASIVLTDDYPIHQVMMRKYGTADTQWSARVRTWIDENRALHDYILAEITARGPVASRELEEAGRAPESWVSSGWTSGRNVSRMLDFLWMQGKIVVAGRKGGQKLWDLTERTLPNVLDGGVLTDDEMVYQAAQKSLRALGVAKMQHIKLHFTRDRYPNLPDILNRLEAEGRIQRVNVENEGKTVAGPWYIHTDDLPLLERLNAGEWKPRTVLLSPFDNLICDRKRTVQMFSFDYRIEIYVPKEKRQYGYYVLPILHGDRFIGRVDSTMNRKQKRLEIHNVYAEPDAPADAGSAVRNTIDELALWLGAKDVDYSDSVPKLWHKALKK